MTDTPKPQSQTHVVESKDGTVKITQPKGKRHHGITVLLDTDDVLREQAGGFASFLRDYAVVGLAIGFIAGTQANTVMKQLVTSFVDPWVKILFGQDLSSRVAHFHHGHDVVLMPWGAFVYVLIEFFLILIVVYALVKLFRLDKLREKS